MGDDITRWWSPPGKRVGAKALRFDFSVSRDMESEPARAQAPSRKRLGAQALAFESPALFKRLAFHDREDF